MSSKHTKITTSPLQTVFSRKAKAAKRVPKPRKPKVEDAKPALPQKMEEAAIKPGEVKNPEGTKPGKTLMSRIREILCERSIYTDPVTKERSTNTRFDDVADAFVRRMECGEFQHTKEYIEREEGKTTQTVQLDGKAIKLYVDIPTEGPEAP